MNQKLINTLYFPRIRINALFYLSLTFFLLNDVLCILYIPTSPILASSISCAIFFGIGISISLLYLFFSPKVMKEKGNSIFFSFVFILYILTFLFSISSIGKNEQIQIVFGVFHIVLTVLLCIIFCLNKNRDLDKLVYSISIKEVLIHLLVVFFLFLSVLFSFFLPYQGGKGSILGIIFSVVFSLFSLSLFFFSKKCIEKKISAIVLYLFLFLLFFVMVLCVHFFSKPYVFGNLFDGWQLGLCIFFAIVIILTNFLCSYSAKCTGVFENDEEKNPHFVINLLSVLFECLGISLIFLCNFSYLIVTNPFRVSGMSFVELEATTYSLCLGLILYGLGTILGIFAKKNVLCNCGVYVLYWFLLFFSSIPLVASHPITDTIFPIVINLIYVIYSVLNLGFVSFLTIFSLKDAGNRFLVLKGKLLIFIFFSFICFLITGSWSFLILLDKNTFPLWVNVIVNLIGSIFLILTFIILWRRESLHNQKYLSLLFLFLVIIFACGTNVFLFMNTDCYVPMLFAQMAIPVFLLLSNFSLLLSKNRKNKN